MADVTLVIDGDTAKAVREMAKLAQAQQKIEGNVKAIGKVSKEAAQEGSALWRTFGEFLAQAKGLAGTVLSVGALTDAVRSYNQQMDTALRKRAELGGQVRGLAVLASSPQEAQANIAAATAMGAKFGIQPGDAAGIYGWAGVATGDKGALRTRAATEMMRLKELGMDVEPGQEAMTQFLARGMSPEQASSLLIAGSQQSGLDAGTIAKIAASSAQYGSPQDALAVASALRKAGGYTPKAIASSVERAGGLLYGDNELTQRMVKMAGAQGADWAGMSAAQRLEFIAAQTAGLSSERMQKRFGLSGEDVGLLRALQEQSGAIGQVAGALSAAGVSAAAEKTAMLSQVPSLQAGQAADEMAASLAASQLAGKDGAEQWRVTRKRLRGARLQNMGYGGLVDQETGSPTFWGQVVSAFLPESRAAEMGSGRVPGSFRPATQEEIAEGRAATERELAAEMALLRESLDKLTTATEKSTPNESGARRIDRNAGL